MGFFKKHKGDEIRVNVGDRILRSVIIKKERKWWDDRSLWKFQERLIVESVVKEISPSGDYYCLTESGGDIWVNGKELVVLAVLEVIETNLRRTK